MTVWYAGRNEVFIPPCIPYRITSTKHRINTVVSHDDGHIVAGNIFRKEINILRKIVHQFGFTYKTIQECIKHKNFSNLS